MPSNHFFSKENICIKMQFSLKFNSYHAIYSTWALVYMVWYWCQNQWQESDFYWNSSWGPFNRCFFPSQFKCNVNFILLLPPYKHLCMEWQLCCHGICKNLLRSSGQQWNYSKAKFPWNLNCEQKVVSEIGLWMKTGNYWTHKVNNNVYISCNR